MVHTLHIRNLLHTHLPRKVPFTIWSASPELTDARPVSVGIPEEGKDGDLRKPGLLPHRGSQMWRQ